MSISYTFSHENSVTRKKDHQIHLFDTDNSNGSRNMIKLQDFLGNLFETVNTKPL